MNINNYLQEYSKKINENLKNISSMDLEKTYNMIVEKMQQGKNIYVCGNGGSAAIADHLVCDHQKGVYHDTFLTPKIYSLSSNIPLMTAISNDIGYEEVYSYQLLMNGKKDDLLIAITSSGNSQNIVNALYTAKKLQMSTIAFTGFMGGKCKNICDINIHVNECNYGVVEDIHQIIMHALAQSIRTNYRDISLNNFIL